MSAGRVLVVSGPSGCGKSTLCRRLLEDERVEFSVSATTRPIRKGEVDGRDYHFLTVPEFRERLAAGAFIEHAEVYGNMYGTLRAPMDAAFAAGRVYLIEIDVQGALQLMGLGVEGIYAFIAPPSEEILRARLTGRGTDAPEVIERRLQKATDEMRERHRYDHVIVNDDLETALAELRGVAGLNLRGAEGASPGGTP